MVGVRVGLEVRVLVRAREVRVAFIARCRGSPNPYHPNPSPSPSPSPSPGPSPSPNLHGHNVARLDVPLYAGLQRGNGPTHLGDLGYGWGQSWGLPDLGIGLAPGRAVCGLRPVALAAGSDARATYLLGVEPTELAVVTLDRRVPRRDRGGVGHLVRVRDRVRVRLGLGLGYPKQHLEAESLDRARHRVGGVHAAARARAGAA